MAQAGGPSSTVYVSASADGKGWSCDHAGQTSVQAAVDTVRVGGTVVVCPGTYKESVSISKRRLELQGRHGAVIDATGQQYGVSVGADHVTITGLTVKNAGVGIDPASEPLGDGIVTGVLSATGPQPGGNYVEITDTVVTGNTGSGIDLNSTHDAWVVRNRSNGNEIGINMSNDLGLPSYDNEVHNNTTSNNVACGIALADHLGVGVYDNVIKGNTANGNGVTGGGAGVLIATPAPGGSVRGNLLADNTVKGNGHAGIELHAHVPNADFSGNRIIGNDVGTNNLIGDFADPDTTGIYLGSASPLTIVVRHNDIEHNVNGVFTAGPVTLKASGNEFSDVAHEFVSVAEYAG